MRLQVRDLWKSYDGRAVLQGVSFTAGPGVTCLMGPSGIGKTTLVRILLELEQPDRGEVTGMERARLSAVFQEDRLLPQLDGVENLRFVLGRAYKSDRAKALLGELGLDGDAEGKPVREFSGGMRRRLALARALLTPFDGLILDEPFTGLDGENRRRAIEAVRRRTEDKLVLLVTHNPADAVDLKASIVQL